MKPWYCLLFVFVSGCSNPFSGRLSPLENYRAKDADCNAVSFQKETLDPTQVKAMVHCLNAAHELDSVEALTQELQDQDWLDFTQYFNASITLKPKSVFALNDYYKKLKLSGQIDYLQNLLYHLLKDPRQNEALAVFLKVEAPLFSKLFNLEPGDLNLASLSQMASLPAYQRLVAENIQPSFFYSFIPPLADYLAAPQTTSIESLYQLLSQNQVDQTWKIITANDPKSSLQKLANFFDWLFRNHDMKVISSTLREIQTHPISCFNHQLPIENPLLTALKKIETLNAKEAKEYLNQELKNTLLLARGYCSIPYSLDPLFLFLDEASLTPGFEEIFTLIKPLLLDPRFIQFLSAEATETWATANAFLSENHFFYDFLTLIDFTQAHALTHSGQAFAATLDQLFHFGTSNQITQGMIALTPLFSQENDFFGKSVQLLDQLTTEFPTFDEEKINLSRASLARFFAKVLSNKNLNAVLNQTATLIKEKKIIPLLDQAIVFFQNFIDRGKTPLLYHSFKAHILNPASPYFYTLNKSSPASTKTKLKATCPPLSTDWEFDSFSSHSTSSYLKYLDSLRSCQCPGPAFTALTNLAHYSSENNELSFLLKNQKSAISSLITLDSALVFSALDRFLDLSRSQVHSFRALLSQSSVLLKQTQSAILSAHEFRKLLAQEMKNTELYSFMMEWLSIPEAPEVSAPSSFTSSHPYAFSKVNVLITRDSSLKQIDFSKGLDELFKNYCPSLDTHDSHCDIDDDQVDRYRQSPRLLAEDIKNEYLKSDQNAFHPLKELHWTHTEQPPQKVGEFEYHLYPLLQLFKQTPKVSAGLFKSLLYIKNQPQDLSTFLRDRSLRFQLIPYVYQDPEYPLSGHKEYTSRIRIRLANDLDRLEMLAINADFKAFHLTRNFGLSFIREIALAWGDEPKSKWPTSLENFKTMEKCSDSLPDGGPSCVRTLLQVKNFIDSEMNKFDREIIQRLGSCDTRGRSSFGRWALSKICNPELSDVSARLFNLRFLISLLDKELPTQNDGIRVLRNLFYGLYESNQNSQKDVFPNGVQIDPSCLSDPLLSDVPNPNCNFDNLTLISRLTRLGFIHQLGLSYLNSSQKQTPIPDFLKILNQVIEQPAITDNLSTFLSSSSATQVIEDGVAFGFNTKSIPSLTLNPLVKTLTYLHNLDWIQRLIDFPKNDPKIISRMSPLLDTLLTQNLLSTHDFNAYLNQNPQSGLIPYLDSLIGKLSPSLTQELSELLIKLAPTQNELSTVLVELHQTKPIHSEALHQLSLRTLGLLSSPRAENHRQKISEYIIGDDLDQLFVAASDTDFIKKTNDFLEALHDDPESSPFFHDLRSFLNLH